MKYKGLHYAFESGNLQIVMEADLLFFNAVQRIATGLSMAFSATTSHVMVWLLLICHLATLISLQPVTVAFSVRIILQ
jgi:hypothetical protein